VTTATDDVQHVRRLAPEILGALVRRYGHFDESEDAVQEALVAAAVQWPIDGRPTSPKAWLLTVATRRLANRLRAEESRRRREQTAAARLPTTPPEPAPSGDDTLTLLFLCCHPELTSSAQAALTLRAVAGLTTAEIARAYLVPEPTMAQRISRAKQRIKESGASFRLPPDAERSDRLRVVLQVLYLLFNEGYTAMAGPDLVRPDLTAEAIRLARELLRLVPDDGEVAGLLALMLLVDARRASRTGPDGALVPLAEQDRTRWDRAAIDEGVALVTASLAGKPLGPYQLQAAIAAVHDEAPTADDTDWPQILELYRLLERMVPGPTVTLNRAVAEAMVHGPRAGLDLLDTLTVDNRVSGAHRFDAVRAHLLEIAGEHREAQATYERAARRTASIPERRYLLTRATRLARDRRDES
jgi:RNA polymerase sigma factor (sigma-70 family)